MRGPIASSDGWPTGRAPTWKSSWTRSRSMRPGPLPSACTRAGTTTGGSTGARPSLASAARRWPPPPSLTARPVAVPVIVDGYNLLYARGEAPAAESRARLVKDLVTWARAEGRKVVLVFDAQKGGTREAREVAHGPVTVRFTRAGELADAFIVRWVAAHPEAVVVTSDRAVQQGARAPRRRGAGRRELRRHARRGSAAAGLAACPSARPRGARGLAPRALSPVTLAIGLYIACELIANVTAVKPIVLGDGLASCPPGCSSTRSPSRCSTSSTSGSASAARGRSSGQRSARISFSRRTRSSRSGGPRPRSSTGSRRWRGCSGRPRASWARASSPTSSRRWSTRSSSPGGGRGWGATAGPGSWCPMRYRPR